MGFFLGFVKYFIGIMFFFSVSFLLIFIISRIISKKKMASLAVMFFGKKEKNGFRLSLWKIRIFFITTIIIIVAVAFCLDSMPAAIVVGLIAGIQFELKDAWDLTVSETRNVNE